MLMRVVNLSSGLLTVVFLLGCSTMPLASKPAHAQGTSAESSERSTSSALVDSQLMFEIMIAELAGRRGQLDVAMAGYLRASERTEDPRVAERATRLASFGRQWPEAESAATRWLSLDPSSADAPRLLAQALLFQNKADAAAERYVQIVSSSDQPSQALLEIEFDLRQHDQPEQTLGVLQLLSQRFSDEPNAHLILARAQAAANNREAALQAVDSALETDPASIDALLLRGQLLSALGRAEEGFAGIERQLEATPDDTRLRLGYAQLLVEAGRFDSVSGELERLYAADSENEDTLLTISLLALDARRLELASQYLSELKASGRYIDQANFYLARISDQQQNFDSAIELYDAVGEGDFKLSASIRAAELTALAGDLKAGRERLDELAAQVPNPVLQPRLISAESRMLQNADKAEEALEILSQGLEQFPDNGDLLYSRALTADSTGNPDMLVDDLSRLIELEPDNAHALNALGYHYADNNIELEKADELLTKAIALLPSDPAIIDSVGWLRYRQGRLDEAIELLREAYRLLPDPEIAAHLSEALWINGAQAEATDLLTQALVESPDDDNLLRVKRLYLE